MHLFKLIRNNLFFNFYICINCLYMKMLWHSTKENELLFSRALHPIFQILERVWNGTGYNLDWPVWVNAVLMKGCKYLWCGCNLNFELIIRVSVGLSSNNFWYKFKLLSHFINSMNIIKEKGNFNLYFSIFGDT